MVGLGIVIVNTFPLTLSLTIAIAAAVPGVNEVATVLIATKSLASTFTLKVTFTTILPSTFLAAP